MTPPGGSVFPAPRPSRPGNRQNMQSPTISPNLESGVPFDLYAHRPYVIHRKKGEVSPCHLGSYYAPFSWTRPISMRENSSASTPISNSQPNNQYNEYSANTAPAFTRTPSQRQIRCKIECPLRDA